MRGSEDIYRKVRNYIKENRMIGAGDTMVAGISGGGDSVAMLSLLRRFREETPFLLFAVHVHHGIRGAEADRDRAFVEELCRKWGIPCAVYAYDVPKLAKEWGMGHEEAGRLVRQEAFARELSRREEEVRGTRGREEAHGTQTREKTRGTQTQEEVHGAQTQEEALGTKARETQAASRIALAHNQDDAAETLLFNLCRGCGLRGLSAMRPVSGKLIRPVLCLEKAEIGEYLKEEKLSFMTDSTNSLEDYTRNRIRRNILPLLKEQINPEAVRHIAGAAELLAQAEDFLTRESAALTEDFVRWEYGKAAEEVPGDIGGELPPEEQGHPGKGRPVGAFLPDSYFSAEPALASDGLMETLYRISGRRKDFTQTHVASVCGLLGKQTGRQISLPCGLLAERTYGGIWIFHPENAPKGVPGVLKTKIFPYKGQKIEEKKYTKWLDCDKIKSGLALRGRREGDFLVINAAGDKKKLNRYLIDEKIPRTLRDRIPLVAQGSEILWVVGYRVGEGYKITPGTKNILELRYEAEELQRTEAPRQPGEIPQKEETQDE